MTLSSILWVGLGGGLGSSLRYIIGMSSSYNSFPLGTFIANIVACLILGLIVGYEHEHHVGWTVKLLFATGFCGGLSTFSTFIFELFQMLQKANHTHIAFYFTSSVILGIISLFIGYKLVRIFPI